MERAFEPAGRQPVRVTGIDWARLAQLRC